MAQKRIEVELDESYRIKAKTAWERARYDATFFSMFSTSECVSEIVEKYSVLAIDDVTIDKNNGPALGDVYKPLFLQFLLELAESSVSIVRQLPFCRTLNTVDAQRKHHNSKSILFSKDAKIREDEFLAIDHFANILDKCHCAPECFDVCFPNPSERIKNCVSGEGDWSELWAQQWIKMKQQTLDVTDREPTKEDAHPSKLFDINLLSFDINLLSLLEALSQEEFGDFASKHLEADKFLSALFESWQPKLDASFCSDLVQRLTRNSGDPEAPAFTEADTAILKAPFGFDEKLRSLTVADVIVWATAFHERAGTGCVLLDCTCG